MAESMHDINKVLRKILDQKQGPDMGVSYRCEKKNHPPTSTPGCPLCDAERRRAEQSFLWFVALILGALSGFVLAMLRR